MARTLNHIAVALGLGFALLACGDSEPKLVSPPRPDSGPTRPAAVTEHEHQPLPIDGNTLTSVGFGFSIEKPANWVFVEPSSLMRDAPMRLRERAELWKLLDDPNNVPAVPLITIAPRADAVRGVDPILTVHVIPLRPEDSDRGVTIMGMLRPTDVVVTFAQGTRSGFPGFQLFPPSVAQKISGIDGAYVDLRYDSESGGASHPTHERLFHLRRGQEFWYVRQMTAEPRSEADGAKLDGILATMRLDP